MSRKEDAVTFHTVSLTPLVSSMAILVEETNRSEHRFPPRDTIQNTNFTHLVNRSLQAGCFLYSFQLSLLRQTISGQVTLHGCNANENSII